MSLVNIAIWSIVGLIVGAGLVFAFAGSSYLRDTLLRQILRSNKTGWALTQRGSRYTLDALDRDEKADSYIVTGPSGEEYAEDGSGHMHTLEGVPFGLRMGSERPIVDVETAEAAHAASEKVADGGELNVTNNGGVVLNDPEDHIVIGKVSGKARKILYVNPYYLRDRVPDILDLRPVAKLMRHDADPDTPQKTAKNAAEAERSLDSMGDLKSWAKNLGYVMLGAITTYIGTTSGGGGGGGGGGAADAVDVGLSVMPTDILIDLTVAVI